MLKIRPHIVLFIALLFAVTACSSVRPQSPDFIAGSKVTSENAGKVTSFDATEIASVVDYYFASRIRGDDKWMDVMPPQSQWTDRLERKLSTHSEWKFTGYQLQDIDDQESEQVSVNVMMELEFKGEADSGVDNIILEAVDGNWIVVDVPT